MLRKLSVYKFFEQVKQEAKKVAWPERKELTTSTIIVMLSVSVFSLVTLVLDYGIHGFVSFLLNIGK